jgi:hypothetical protein
MEVASCKPAFVNQEGNVLSLGNSGGIRKPGEVVGVSIEGKNVIEEPVGCYPDMPAVAAQAGDRSSVFFVSGDETKCDQFNDRTIVGRTEHPCCDIPPLPGEVHPGTCHIQGRLLVVLQTSE